MANIIEYSTKATAVRGIKRAGISDRPEDFATKREDGKFQVDMDRIQEHLALKQRGPAVVLSDADKAQIRNEAIDRGAVAPVVTESASEQMEQDEIDADLAATCGYSHCPACGIHLSNGVTDFDGMVDCRGSEKAAYELQKHEWSCLGCGAEWGAPVVLKGAKGSKAPTRHYVNKSTVDGAVALCHEFYSANPDLRRKDAIQAMVDKGVAFYTARTQYQKWFKAQKSARAK